MPLGAISGKSQDFAPGLFLRLAIY